MSGWLASPAEAPSPTTGAVLREYDSIVAEFSQLSPASNIKAVSERHVLLARYVSEAAAQHPDIVGYRSAWVSETLVVIEALRESASQSRRLLDQLARELLSICESLSDSMTGVSDAWVSDLLAFSVQTTESTDRLRGLRIVAEVADRCPEKLAPEIEAVSSIADTPDEREAVARIYTETISAGEPPVESAVETLFVWAVECTAQNRATMATTIHTLAIEYPEVAAEHVERLEPILDTDSQRLHFLYTRILMELSPERPETVYRLAEPFLTDSATDVLRRQNLQLYRALVQLVPERATAELDWFFEQIEAGSEDVLYIGGQVLMLFAELVPEIYQGRAEQAVDLLHKVEGDKLEELLAALCIVTEHCDIALSTAAADTIGSFLDGPPTVRGYAALVLESASIPESWDVPSGAVSGCDYDAGEGTQASEGTRAKQALSTDAMVSRVIEEVESETEELDPTTEHVSGFPFWERQLYRGETVVDLLERAEELAERRSSAVLSLIPELVEYAQHESDAITIQSLRALIVIAETYPGIVANELPADLWSSETDSNTVLTLKVGLLREVLSSERSGLIGVDEEMQRMVAFLVSMCQRSESTLRRSSLQCLSILSRWEPGLLQEHIAELLAALDTEQGQEVFITGAIIKSVALQDPMFLQPHFGELLTVLQAVGTRRAGEDVWGEVSVGLDDLFRGHDSDDRDEIVSSTPYLISLISVLYADPGLVVSQSEKLGTMLRAGQQPQTNFAFYLLKQSFYVQPEIAEEFLPLFVDLLGEDQPALCQRTAARMFSFIAMQQSDVVLDRATAVVSALEQSDASQAGFIEDCLSTLAAVIEEIPEEAYPQFKTILSLFQRDEAFRASAIKILSAYSHVDEELRPHRRQFEAVCSESEVLETKLAAVDVLMGIESRAGGSR